MALRDQDIPTERTTRRKNRIAFRQNKDTMRGALERSRLRLLKTRVWKVNSDENIINFQPRAWQLIFCVSQWAFGKEIGE